VGTEKKGIWVVVSFDPKTTKEQRDALAPIMLKTYGLEWPELKKLKREPGAEGKGVVLKNVKYFNAVQNDGFQLYRSTEHRANLAGHEFPTPIAMPS